MNSIAVRNQIQHLLLPVKDKVHTLTSDHGKEFAAWERGTNENTNGLLRQYFPKKHNLQSVAEPEIEQAMLRLNFKPRKWLRFKTPAEVFFQSSVALTS